MVSKKRRSETAEETSTCDSKPSKLVMLNPLDSSLASGFCSPELNIEGDGLRCSVLGVVRFTYSGTRGNIGIKNGKYCFSCRVVKNQKVDTEEISPNPRNICVIGISSGNDGVEQLGGTQHSFGYVSTGKFSNLGKSYDYGEKFGEGDIIMCAVDLDPMVNYTRSISFSKNGKSLGPAIHLDAGLELFPHVMVKNVIVEMQFSPDDGLIPEEGYKPWSCALDDGNAVFGPGISGPSESEGANKRVKENPKKWVKENMVGLTCEYEPSRPAILKSNQWAEVNFKYKPTRPVILNPLDRSLEFNISDGLRGFAFCQQPSTFHGARANVGIKMGKYCFGCRVVEYLETDMKDTPPEQQNFCHIGISRGDDDVKNLGSKKHSFAYASTGNFSESGNQINYGEKFGADDRIVCAVDLNPRMNQPSFISFSKNGKSFVPVKFYNKRFQFFPHVILKNVIIDMEFSPEDGLVPEEGYKPWSCALPDGSAVFGPGSWGPERCNFSSASDLSTSRPSYLQSHDPSLQPRYSLNGSIYQDNQQIFPLPLPPVNYNDHVPRQVMNSAYLGSPAQGMDPPLFFKQTSQVTSASNALHTTSPYGSYASLGGTYGSNQIPLGDTTQHSAPQGMDPSLFFKRTSQMARAPNAIVTTSPYGSYAPFGGTYGLYQRPPCKENYVLPKSNDKLRTNEPSFYEANRSLYAMNPQSLANNVSLAGVASYSHLSTPAQTLKNNVFPADVSYSCPSTRIRPLANNVSPTGVVSYSRPGTPFQPFLNNVFSEGVALYSRPSPAQPSADNASTAGVVPHSRPSAFPGDPISCSEEDLEGFFSTLSPLDFDNQRPPQVNYVRTESEPQGRIDSSPVFNRTSYVDGVSNAYNYSLNNSNESNVGLNLVGTTFPYGFYNPHDAYGSYQNSVTDPYVRPFYGETRTFLPPLHESHDFSPYAVTSSMDPTQAETPTFGNVPENQQPNTGGQHPPEQGF